MGAYKESGRVVKAALPSASLPVRDSLQAPASSVSAKPRKHRADERAEREGPTPPDAAGGHRELKIRAVMRPRNDCSELTHATGRERKGPRAHTHRHELQHDDRNSGNWS